MSASANVDFKRLFMSASIKILVLRPVSYEIVVANEAFLKATMTCESDIVGKGVFEVFPNDPSDLQADGAQTLLASLKRVEAFKTTDTMSVQRYPVPGVDGEFEERYWSPVNSPVLDEHGEIEFIMIRVEDVTSIHPDILNSNVLDNAESSDGVLIHDIMLRKRELKRTMSKLQEHETRIRTAERMLALGAWEYNPRTDKMNWSKEVFDIYQISNEDSALDLQGELALVHPDDRPSWLENRKALADKNISEVVFEHRLAMPDGQVKYVKSVGKRHCSPDGEIVVGYVQDITAIIVSRQKEAFGKDLIELASQKAELGGWRVELASGEVIWSPATALIHDMPATFSPSTVDEAIEFYAPEYRPVIKGAFESCIEHGDLVDVVCQLQLPSGRKPWVRSIGVVERNEKDEVVAVQGAFQDITKLHEAQLRADAAEQQRLDVLDSISDAVIALDEHWNFTYVNRHALDLMERADDNLIGKNLWQEFPEAVDSQFHIVYKNVMENRAPQRFEAFYPPTNKWFKLNVYPTTDGIAVYYHDVTKERQNQEHLRLVDAALSRQNDIVIITTADGLEEPDGPRIVYVNHAFEKLTGFSKKEAIGNTPRILQGPDSDRQQLDRIRTALQNRQSIRCEVLNYTKSKSTYWLELDITPLFDDQGKCTHFVAVERDITERKEMEQKLRESQKLEAVGHLTGGVAHDFNNLLTVILGNSEILAEEIKDESLRSLAEVTFSAAQSGAELTSRLLAFARRQPLEPKVTDINELVESMLVFIRRTLTENIELTFKPHPFLGITEVDAGELNAALLNLVVNARDAMQSGGKLTIETKNIAFESQCVEEYSEVPAGDYVMLSVSDTGAGMTPETMRRAFEPFFTTKPVDMGSGLGLSMVFGFTKQSGGHISIESDLGRGSCVKLYFPRIKSTKQHQSLRQTKPKAPRGHEHILLVEDNMLVLRHIESQLGFLGYRVTTATSGPEALDLLNTKTNIDLLLTDIVMPGGMNGRELAKQALSIYPELRVLFTSGYSEDALVHHGRLDAGLELLKKPYTQLELANKVQHALQGTKNESF